MKKIFISIIIIFSSIAFSDIYHLFSLNVKYDESKLYEFGTPTMYNGYGVDPNDSNSTYWYAFKDYLTLLEQIDKKYNENPEQKISKKDKIRYDNILITYVGQHIFSSVRGYLRKIDEAEELVKKNLLLIRTTDWLWAFTYSYKQYIKEAETPAEYKKAILEIDNDWHYLWIQPFEWVNGKGEPIESIRKRFVEE